MLYRNGLINIEKMLAQFPVVALIGARQTGKTTLARMVGKDWQYIDCQNKDTLPQSLSVIFERYPEQLILDEVQALPEITDILRGVIDKNRGQNGRFIITGSSSPELLSQVADSLAGRVAIVEVGTLKLNEIFQKPFSKFFDILRIPINKHTKDEVLSLSPVTDIASVYESIFTGGYPEPVVRGDDEFRETWFSQYFSTYVDRDIRALFPGLNLNTYRLLIRSLADLHGGQINISDLSRIIGVSDVTVRSYLDIAHATFVWRRLESYQSSALRSAMKMPKGYFRDSGLVRHLMHIFSREHLESHPKFGNIFEGFVIEELMKGFNASAPVTVKPYYLRTRGGFEVDLILEGIFGTIPIEIKSAANLDTRKLRSLAEFVEEQNLAFGLVINQGAKPELLDSNIIQLPVSYL